MIIDTNGFEIGDEVWYSIGSFSLNSRRKIMSFIVIGFEYYTNRILLLSKYGLRIDINNCYHTEQECQLECDRLNGINHD